MENTLSDNEILDWACPIQASLPPSFPQLLRTRWDEAGDHEVKLPDTLSVCARLAAETNSGEQICKGTWFHFDPV